MSEEPSAELREFALSCPVPLPPGERITLGHGSGGKLSAQLIRDLFVPVFVWIAAQLVLRGSS